MNQNKSVNKFMKLTEIDPNWQSLEFVKQDGQKIMIVSNEIQ